MLFLLEKNIDCFMILSLFDNIESPMLNAVTRLESDS